MSEIDKFVRLFAVPEFVVPHLSLFLSEREMILVARLNGEKCSVSKIVLRMNSNFEDVQDLLDACYNKHLVHREEVDGDYIYYGADFYELLDYICKFDENYPLIDKDLRRTLDKWCYRVYRERMDAYLGSLLEGEAVDRAPETFLMIEDLDQVLESVKDIRLVPCNCRKLANHCVKPTETCLSFDDSITDRTFGRSLSKEEAKELVWSAHKKGLMHQVNSDWRTMGPTYMCNCCSCCCYPLRLAQEKGTKGVFPISQFMVQRDETKCSHCGACAKRCNFGAFYSGEAKTVVKGKSRRKVELNLNKCWGCGICKETCPTKAIAMTQIIAIG
ncbi:4Fe-4S ferredoxin [Desulfosporosinus sp. HMP52]|uniref:ATP-binding protein n=1 Tax=Desulfosporosinus sp. HMP52 TaxID=1487923 RepID=UPI00051FA8A7|nr:4Fe-4S binding protein [Desulfosporosinus sp. HMP52]KGK83289.1 4Fe-4S ferredoxin [Desulfosporosinus sp. HMP52]